MTFTCVGDVLRLHSYRKNAAETEYAVRGMDTDVVQKDADALRVVVDQVFQEDRVGNDAYLPVISGSGVIDSVV